MTVDFTVEPVTIEVEAESMDDAWSRRHDLAAAAKPEDWTVHPSYIEADE